jgi:hypothetical protein
MNTPSEASAELARVVDEISGMAELGVSAEPMTLAYWRKRLQPLLSSHGGGGEAVAVPGDLALGETIYTPPGEEVRFCYTRGQPDNVNAWRLGEACRRASEHPGGDYIDHGLSLLKELEARGYGVFRFVKDTTPQPRGEGMVLVPQRFVDKVQAAARAVHPTATAVLVDEAVDLLAAAPGEGSGEFLEIPPFLRRNATTAEIEDWNARHSSPPPASQSATPSDEVFTQREITQALAAHYRKTTGDERHMAGAIMAAETAAAIVKSIREQRATMAAIREVQP